MSGKIHQTCAWCGCAFEAWRANVARGWSRLCSRSCKARYASSEAGSASRIAARFWLKVDKMGPVLGDGSRCWVWTGSTDGRDGRGQLNIAQRPIKAPRVAWFLEHGEWPKLWVLHRCDNPSCVNHHHLFQGTNSDNVADSVSKFRRPKNPILGSRQVNAKLSEEMVRSARLAWADGETAASLARRLGVSKPTMGAALKGETWSHVT